MPSYKVAFGSFLKTEDLQGRAVPVAITHVSLETIKGQDGKPDERKLVAHFAGKDKGLVLNKTRCEQLEAIFQTDDYESWVGACALVPGVTKFGGKDVACINVAPRLAPTKGKAKPAPEPEPEPDVEAEVEDAIPF